MVPHALSPGRDASYARGLKIKLLPTRPLDSFIMPIGLTGAPAGLRVFVTFGSIPGPNPEPPVVVVKILALFLTLEDTK